MRAGLLVETWKEGKDFPSYCPSDPSSIPEGEDFGYETRTINKISINADLTWTNSRTRNSGVRAAARQLPPSTPLAFMTGAPRIVHHPSDSYFICYQQNISIPLLPQDHSKWAITHAPGGLDGCSMAPGAHNITTARKLLYAQDCEREAAQKKVLRPYHLHACITQGAGRTLDLVAWQPRAGCVPPPCVAGAVRRGH